MKRAAEQAQDMNLSDDLTRDFESDCAIDFDWFFLDALDGEVVELDDLAERFLSPPLLVFELAGMVVGCGVERTSRSKCKTVARKLSRGQKKERRWWI